MSAVWGGGDPADQPGRDARRHRGRAAAGEIALVVGGVDPADLPDPELRSDALESAPFVVSLELRDSRGHRPRRRRASRSRPRSRRPAPSSTGRAGSRPFDAALRSRPARCRTLACSTARRRDGRRPSGLPDAAAARAEIAAARRLERHSARRSAAVRGPRRRHPAGGEAVLATWHLLLDDGRAAGRRAAPRRHRASRLRARLSPTTAEEIGVNDGELRHRQHRPGRGHAAARRHAEMPDGVVWLPTRSPGSHVRADARRQPRATSYGSVAAEAATVTRRARPRRRRGGAHLGRVRPRPVVAHPHQDGRHLRLPARHDAAADLGRAPHRRPHAAAARPQPGRAVRAAAEPRRRHEAGAEGRPDPGRGGQAALHPRAARRGDPGVPGVRRHPVRPGRVDLRPPHPAAAHRPAGRRAVHPRDGVDRRLRHRARRLVVAVDRTRCSAALRSAAQVISYEVAMGLALVGGVPLRRLAVDERDRRRAGAALVRRCR